MRCVGEFKNDRTCDICEIVLSGTHAECIKLHKERVSVAKELSKIKKYCPYLKTCYDEYQPFDACNKDDKAYGRFAPLCNVCLECSQYIK